MIFLDGSIDVCCLLEEIECRQGCSWNDGRINDRHSFPNINRLFAVINSDVFMESFMYRGDLYRIHTSYGKYVNEIDESKELLIGRVCDDGSCSVLPLTQFDNSLVAFSKSWDFTKNVFTHVFSNRKAKILHVNTGKLYGIDVVALWHYFGISRGILEQENEVLFPLKQELLVKEYTCTPNQFKYYMRNKGVIG